MKNLWLLLWTALVMPLLKPWKAIRGRHLHFTAWLLGLPVLGLAGFWIPLGLAGMKGMPLADVSERLLYGGVLASFSVTILAEGLLGLLSAEKAGSNSPAVGVRSIVGVVSLGLFAFLVAVMINEALVPSELPVATAGHVWLAIAALVTAAYLYCFRYSSWEKGVEDLKDEEDADIDHLSKAAMGKAGDRGVKL